MRYEHKEKNVKESFFILEPKDNKKAKIHTCRLNVHEFPVSGITWSLCGVELSLVPPNSFFPFAQYIMQRVSIEELPKVVTCKKCINMLKQRKLLIPVDVITGYKITYCLPSFTTSMEMEIEDMSLQEALEKFPHDLSTIKYIREITRQYTTEYIKKFKITTDIGPKIFPKITF